MIDAVTKPDESQGQDRAATAAKGHPLVMTISPREFVVTAEGRVPMTEDQAHKV
jgi:hypothetical protein